MISGTSRPTTVSRSRNVTGDGIETQPTVIDLDRVELDYPGPDNVPNLVLCVSADGLAKSEAANLWMTESMFCLTEAETHDPRFVQVPSVTAAIDLLRLRLEAHPLSAAVLMDVLRSYSGHLDANAGLVTESLAYSTLQAGPEFAHWLSQQKPRRRHQIDDAVSLERIDGRLTIAFDCPARHNAFSDALRAGLLTGLDVATADPTIVEVQLRGNGPSFCSGGDLREFGLFDNSPASHVARMTHSPAARLSRLRTRLGGRLTAQVHGAVLGSGLEMAAFCGTLIAQPGAVFGLPELDLGLIPGAGGTVSVTRRIARWRTAYLIVAGQRIDAATALEWGLIDAISMQDGAENS